MAGPWDTPPTPEELKQAGVWDTPPTADELAAVSGNETSISATPAPKGHLSRGSASSTRTPATPVEALGTHAVNTAGVGQLPRTLAAEDAIVAASGLPKGDESIDLSSLGAFATSLGRRAAGLQNRMVQAGANFVTSPIETTKRVAAAYDPDTYRAGLDQVTEDQPVASFAGNVAGALASGPRGLPQLLTLGALQGAGHSRADLTEGVGDPVEGLQQGARLAGDVALGAGLTGLGVRYPITTGLGVYGAQKGLEEAGVMEMTPGQETQALLGAALPFAGVPGRLAGRVAKGAAGRSATARGKIAEGIAADDAAQVETVTKANRKVLDRFLGDVEDYRQREHNRASAKATFDAEAAENRENIVRGTDPALEKGERRLEGIRKTLQKEIDKGVKGEAGDAAGVNKQYDRQLRELGTGIDRATKARQKALSKAEAELAEAQRSKESVEASAQGARAQAFQAADTRLRRVAELQPLDETAQALRTKIDESYLRNTDFSQLDPDAVYAKALADGMSQATAREAAARSRLEKLQQPFDPVAEAQPRVDPRTLVPKDKALEIARSLGADVNPETFDPLAPLRSAVAKQELTPAEISRILAQSPVKFGRGENAKSALTTAQAFDEFADPDLLGQLPRTDVRNQAAREITPSSIEQTNPGTERRARQRTPTPTGARHTPEEVREVQLRARDAEIMQRLADENAATAGLTDLEKARYRASLADSFKRGRGVSSDQHPDQVPPEVRRAALANPVEPDPNVPRYSRTVAERAIQEQFPTRSPSMDLPTEPPLPPRLEPLPEFAPTGFRVEQKVRQASFADPIKMAIAAGAVAAKMPAAAARNVVSALVSPDPAVSAKASGLVARVMTSLSYPDLRARYAPAIAATRGLSAVQLAYYLQNDPELAAAVEAEGAGVR